MKFVVSTAQSPLLQGNRSLRHGCTAGPGHLSTDSGVLIQWCRKEWVLSLNLFGFGWFRVAAAGSALVWGCAALFSFCLGVLTPWSGGWVCLFCPHSPMFGLGWGFFSAFGDARIFLLL